MKKILTILIVFISLFSFTSCDKNTSESIDIITSCYPIYDFTTRIVGDKLTVSNLVSPGVEPHDYEPTPKDIANLTEAKLFIINGNGFEHYLNSLPKEMGAKMVIASANIEPIYSNINKDTVDPHMWLDISNAITMMENIKNQIVMIDPANKEYYEDNFTMNRYLFEGLDAKYKETLTNLKSTYLVTSHEAFGYLCKAYGLNQLPIRGLSTEDEPTADDITRIIKDIAGKNVTTIFYEDLVSDEIAKKIASETGLKCDILYPIEGISKDMGNENYLTLMAKNLVQIQKALA